MNANTKLVGPNVDVSSPVYLAVLERVDFRFSQIVILPVRKRGGERAGNRVFAKFQGQGSNGGQEDSEDGRGRGGGII